MTLERVLKLSHSFLVKRPPIPYKNGRKKYVLTCFLNNLVHFYMMFSLVKKLADPEYSTIFLKPFLKLQTDVAKKTYKIFEIQIYSQEF